MSEKEKNLRKLADMIKAGKSTVDRKGKIVSSCHHACSPIDFYKGGKCDKNGCYED